MKAILRLSLLLLLFNFQSCTTSAQHQTSEPEVIDVKNASVLMEEGEVYILDVRTPAEVDKGRIEGAENLDIFNWEDFTLGVEKLEKSEPVLVYCKVGGRSAKAAKYLVENGFTKVYDLNGGILAWQEAGKSIVKN